MDRELYDVTIIGGGPVGLFTTYYSGMRQLKTKLIEYQPTLGGKVSFFFPEKIIRDIGGISQITGEELIKQMIAQAKTFNPKIVLGEKVIDLKRQENGTFILTSKNGNKHFTKTVILAAGFGTFNVNKLNLEGIEIYEGKNLHYSIKRLEYFRDKNVVIAGGGNSAVDWANELEGIAKKVTIIHRRREFSGHESEIAKMKNSSVQVKIPYILENVEGNGILINSINIRNLETNEEERINLDELIVNHGFKMDYGAIMDWGLDTEGNYVRVDKGMNTNIPGIYAAGDIVNYPNKLRIIAGGLAEGPTALNSAKGYMDPKAEAMAMYSTHNEAFK